MPKTNEELEAELSSLNAKLLAESQERSKLLEKLSEVAGKATALEASKSELAKRLEAAESIKADVEKLKSAPQPQAAPAKKEEPVNEPDIDSLLTDEDKVAADEAFNKLSDGHQQWVLSDKKNRAEFLSDIVGKAKAGKPRSLFSSKQPTLSIRDQIRQALNLETAEEIPPGGPGVRTPAKKKPAAAQEQEVVTSLSNGDVLGALKNKKQ